LWTLQTSREFGLSETSSLASVHEELSKSLVGLMPHDRLTVRGEYKTVYGIIPKQVCRALGSSKPGQLSAAQEPARLALVTHIPDNAEQLNSRIFLTWDSSAD